MASKLQQMMDMRPAPLEEELWKLDANCVGLDTDLFFLDYKGAQYPNQMYAICNNCPVKKECIDYATRYCMDGFWGGTTPKQRQRMRAKSSTPTGVTVQ